MKLFLEGHNYKFAVEQIMLSMFPEERPVYDQDVTVGAEESSAWSHLGMSGDGHVLSKTVLRRGGVAVCGLASVQQDNLTDKLTTDRLLQKIVKQSFYRAAEKFRESPPVWGSLTGIRPVKLAEAELAAGAGREDAVHHLIREYCVSPERAAMCADAALVSLNIKKSLAPGDITLYVGIPFCPTRCAYCSFVSNSVEKSFGLIEPFTEHLLSEISLLSKLVHAHNLRVAAVYIGGGTPTALPADAFCRIMRELKESFDLSRVREYTVEAGRPDTITEQKLKIMLKYGASRICVNPQSMSPEVLKSIGRGHSPEDALSAAQMVRRSGAVLNMDIIAGLPGDTPEGFFKTLNTVLTLSPENITVHTMSLKKGSLIMQGGMPLPDGVEVAAMLEYASHRLRECGYEPYYIYRQKFISGGFENIGWALPGYEGFYNICMMEEHCTVLALGGGGVTKLVSQGGNIERIFNAKYPREYILGEDKIYGKIEQINKFFIAEGKYAVSI